MAALHRQDTSAQVEDSADMSLAKKFGIAGFIFFFVKGLLWIIVPSVIAWFGMN